MALVVIAKLCIGYYIKHHQYGNTGLRVANKSFSHYEKLHQYEGCSVKESIDHTCLFWETEIHGYFIHAAPHGLIARFPFDALCYLILYSYFKKKKISVEPSLLL